MTEMVHAERPDVVWKRNSDLLSLSAGELGEPNGITRYKKGQYLRHEPIFSSGLARAQRGDFRGSHARTDDQQPEHERHLSEEDGGGDRGDHLVVLRQTATPSR